MTTPAPAIETDLEGWLARQPVWLQHGAKALLDGKVIGQAEFANYADMAVTETSGKLALPDPLPHFGSLGASEGGAVSLQSLSKISGINHLNPRNPLDFGTEKLTVIYGPNGSGKTSYVRILNNSCHSRHKGEIHQNVFEAQSVEQSCTISFSDGSGQHSFAWTPGSKPSPELSTIDIFDAHCGQSYLSTETPPAYEPRLLIFLSALASLCDYVAKKLTDAISAKSKALPILPLEHANTNGGRWYESLKATTNQSEVDTHCSWAEQDQGELNALAKYLAETSPKDRAKELEVKQGFVDGLVITINEHCAAHSDEASKALMTLRRTAREKQQTAELAAKANLSDAVLNGVGTKQWLDLWSIARTYSFEVAYPEKKFPQTDADARCVLCQQELSPDAKRRLQSFDEYVTNEAATAAKTAKEKLQEAIAKLPALPDADTLRAKVTSAGMDNNMLESLLGFYDLLVSRRAVLIADKETDEFGPYPVIEEWTAVAKTLSDDYAQKAKHFLEGFNESERTAKQNKQKELAARKWIAGQKTAVEAEVKRLGEVAVLEKAKDLCGTKAISLKKGALAEQLITPAYVEAFNSELKHLGANRVKVSLEKTRVEKGAVLHQVKLRGAIRHKPIQEVLSEGEHRIVSLAAFLADVAAKPNGSTFVFDDPISSLDLDFEEAVVQRLVDLSKTRQVLVFTHRLSLLGMLQDYAKKADIPIRVISICMEPWGAGEPGDQTIETSKPKAVLNQHLPARIAAARAVLEKEGDAAYRLHAQSICTETRKIIERLIELDLLADVIQRHRRAINTQGKLEKLSDIKPEDCAFLDEMMTKYSRYEHSQSSEAPVELPQPDELNEDVAKLKKWRDELEDRRK